MKHSLSNPNTFYNNDSNVLKDIAKMAVIGLTSLALMGFAVAAAHAQDKDDLTTEISPMASQASWSMQADLGLYPSRAVGNWSEDNWDKMAISTWKEGVELGKDSSHIISAMEAELRDEQFQMAKIIKGSTTHRKVLDANDYPWSAIGQVNTLVSNRVRFSCTGALIGERLVLTASHCLYIKGTNEWAKPQMVSFVAGYQRGDFIDYARGEKIIRPKAYDGSQGITGENLANDWALIVLDKPIGKKVGYLGWKAMSKKEFAAFKKENGRFALAGYPRDRKHVISLEDNCVFSGLINGQNLIGHRCQILNGDSGAPLGIMEDGKLTVIGVNSAAGHDSRGKGINSAVPLASFASQIQAVLEETEDSLGDVAKGRPGKGPQAGGSENHDNPIEVSLLRVINDSLNRPVEAF